MKPSDLVKILDQYFTDAKVIAAHPASYLRQLNLDERALFARGATFFVLSIGVVYFLLIPAFWIHGRIVSPDMHQLVTLFGLIAFGILFHISFKLLGGSGTLRETIGAYGFVAGAVAPVHALLMYPTALKFGPEFILLTSAPSFQAFTAKINPEASDVVFLAFNMMVSGIVESILGFLIAVPSLATVHGVGYARSFTSLLAPVLFVLFLVSMFS